MRRATPLVVALLISGRPPAELMHAVLDNSGDMTIL